MSVFDVIRHRRSVGKVKPDMPPREKIERMLEAATYAPNHHITEPWRFIVLTGPAREALGELMEQSLREKMLETESEKAQAALNKERNKPLRAPVVIVVASVKPETPKTVDIENVEAVAAAIQNMLLVAAEEGLATIWRSGEPSRDPKIKAHFDLSPEEHIVGFVYVGYPAIPHPERFPTPYQLKTEWRGQE
ncbi:MAG: nitroreductase [Chloroflexi bacterium]|jgi:nitroreductase|nr:nitroreductase [Chloroflexota bacterium]